MLAVSTGGHGGILVDPEVFDLAHVLRDGADGYIERWAYTHSGEEAHRVVGFEEDCGWALLIAHHPELAAAGIERGYFAPMEPAELVEHARRSAASIEAYASLVPTDG